MHPAVQIDEPILQPGFILLPPHAVHSGRSSALKRREAVPEQIEAQMVEQSGEPFLLPFPCCFSHTVQSLGHALPALCRVHVRRNDVLLRLCPSLPNLRRRSPLFVRLVHRYYGTVRLLQRVHARRSVHGLRGPALIARPRRAGDLPVLVHVVSQRARVLRLRRTGKPLALAWLPCCLPPFGKESASCTIGFSKLNSPAPRYLCLRFKRHLAMPPARLEARMESLFSFPVGLFHPLQHAALSRRSPNSRHA